MNKQDIIELAKTWDSEKHPIMAYAEQCADLWIELIEMQRATDEQSGSEERDSIRAMWKRADEDLYQSIAERLVRELIGQGDLLMSASADWRRDWFIKRIRATTIERHDAFTVMISQLKSDGTRDLTAERYALS